MIKHEIRRYNPTDVAQAINLHLGETVVQASKIHDLLKKPGTIRLFSKDKLSSITYHIATYYQLPTLIKLTLNTYNAKGGKRTPRSITYRLP